MNSVVQKAGCVPPYWKAIEKFDSDARKRKKTSNGIKKQNVIKLGVRKQSEKLDFGAQWSPQTRF